MDANMVIAVNEQDEVLGYLDKLEAHQQGVLHRAISVFIFNSKGEWLLQQRAEEKYHSGLLWSNASCTHPMKGETDLEAANRRLREEIGLEADLSKLFSFQYRADLDNDLIEHELDHIFVGTSDETPTLNPEEVVNYRYISSDDLKEEIRSNPENFTEWFKMLVDKVLEKTA